MLHRRKQKTAEGNKKRTKGADGETPPLRKTTKQKNISVRADMESAPTMDRQNKIPAACGRHPLCERGRGLKASGRSKRRPYKLIRKTENRSALWGKRTCTRIIGWGATSMASPASLRISARTNSVGLPSAVNNSKESPTENRFR